MGTRGPQPLPSAVKQARGTYRPDRAAGNEATPLGKPMCPNWLNADAKKEFRRLVKLLGGMGLVGAVDSNALARYASTWVRWRQSAALLEKAGEVVIYKDENGKPKSVQPSAFASIVRGLSEELSRMEAAFGMTPSSRSRINVAPVLPEIQPPGLPPVRVSPPPAIEPPAVLQIPPQPQVPGR